MYWIQSVVVNPLLGWMLRERSLRSIAIAVGVVVVLALGTLAVEVVQRDATLYDQMGVACDATNAELQAMYRFLAVRLHPDHNMSPYAEDEFRMMKEAYDILRHGSKRAAYDAFGPAALQGLLSIEYTEIVVTYLSLIALVFFMTLGRDASRARGMAYMALLVLLCVDISYRNTAQPLFSLLAPYMPLFQQIALLHTLFPFIVNLLILYASFTYVDHQQWTVQLVSQIYRQQLQLHKELALLSARLPQPPPSTEAQSAEAEQSTEPQHTTEPLERTEALQTEDLQKSTKPREPQELREQQEQPLQSMVAAVGRHIVSVLVFYLVSQGVFAVLQAVMA